VTSFVELTVSNLTVNDIADILDISLECGLCLWSAASYRAEIIRDDSIMIKLSDSDGKVVGFAVGRIFELGPGQYTIELTNIGLRQTIRNQGFGSFLLKAFLSRCVDSGASSVILEVRESNTVAINFYRKFGFESTGRRRGFYSDPLEDALTMSLKLTRRDAQEFHT
jgi:[ribosomal protein S18]-alanine N-acetyltransferase